MPRFYIATMPGHGLVMPPPGQPTRVPLSTAPTTITPVVAPRAPVRKGRMKVLLTLHGGEQALSDVMEGLVERNARAIREGAAPPLSQLRPDQTRLVREPAWYDAPSALAQGRVTRGTLAAWEAGEIRARGHDDVSVAYVGGVPVVVGANKHQIGDPSLRFGRDPSDRRPPVGGSLGLLNEGRVVETLYLTIDDEAGLPVREIGNKIAAHNARRIAKMDLPDLYSANVQYRTEGSPEKWWDAEEILLAGYDDCEGLSAYNAGWHIAKGRPAEVWTRVIAMPSPEMGGTGKGRLFHAVSRIQDADGQWVVDDPSARLGMPVPAWYKAFAQKRRAQGQDI